MFSLVLILVVCYGIFHVGRDVLTAVSGDSADFIGTVLGYFIVFLILSSIFS